MGNKQGKGDKDHHGASKSKTNLKAATPSKSGSAAASSREFVFKLLTIGDQGALSFRRCHGLEAHSFRLTLPERAPLPRP